MEDNKDCGNGVSDERLHVAPEHVQVLQRCVDLTSIIWRCLRNDLHKNYKAQLLLLKARDELRIELTKLRDIEMSFHDSR